MTAQTPQHSNAWEHQIRAEILRMKRGIKVSDLAKLLGVSRDAIYREIKAGSIPEEGLVRIGTGRTFRVTRDAALAYFERCLFDPLS